MARRRPNSGAGGAVAGSGEGPGLPELDQDRAWVEGVGRRLIEWYDRAHREALPWREERDPYRVLVSEVMLVQTTTAMASGFYDRFLQRFPTVESLAEASETEVLKAWEGLGYYRRARQLQAAARAIVAEHGGRVPETAEALRRLPGVGPYIAGAILSFAFDQPAPIVEANTQRVLARLLGWSEPLGSTATTKRLWTAAARLVPSEQPGRFNQAMMDLGALVCVDTNPRCLICPLRTLCRAFERGWQDRLPAKRPRVAVSAVEELSVVVEHRGRWLMVRRGLGRLWEGMWEFPTLHREGPDPAGRGTVASDPVEALQALVGIEVQIDPGPPLLRLGYGVTRYRVRVDVRRGRVVEPRRWGAPEPGPGFDAAAWLTPDQADERPRSVAARQIVAHLRNDSKPRPRGKRRSGPDESTP